LYCIVLTARTAALSFFQNPAHDHESNPHAILIRIWFFSPLNLQKGYGLDSRIYGIIGRCSSVTARLGASICSARWRRRQQAVPALARAGLHCDPCGGAPKSYWVVSKRTNVFLHKRKFGLKVKLVHLLSF